MRRQLAVVAVVALVVLAGCPGGSGSSTATEGEPTPEPTPTEGMDTPTDEPDTDTPTESSEPTDSATATPTATATEAEPTATPTPTEGDSTPAGDLQPVSEMSDLPAGVSEQKVTNASALFAAQDRALTGTGFQYDMILRNSSGEDARIRIANDTTTTRLRFDLLDRDLFQGYYLAPDEAGVYNSSTDRRTYGTGPTSVRQTSGLLIAIIALYPRGYVMPLEWETEGTYTTDGEQRLVLSSDARNDSVDMRSIFAPQLVENGQTLQGVTGQMEVNSAGVIRYANVSVTVDTASGSTLTKGLEFSVSPLQRDSLDRPDWLSGAPSASLSAEEDDRLLAYEYDGADPIEAGTNLSVNRVSGFGGVLVGNATLDQSVSQGDTVYLYQTEEGVTASVNERPTLPDGATAFQGQVSVTTRIGNDELEVGIRLGP
jgi:hypothetical protein